MLFQKIAVIDANGRYLPDAYVGILHGVIDYVDTVAPENPECYGEAYDGKDRLLVPGMYNAHAHAPMTLLRGYAENLPLQSWLNDRVFPFEAHITSEDAYWATMLAMAEMARFGTVSFSDMYYHSSSRAQAVVDAGMKANLSPTLIAFGDGEFDTNPGCTEGVQLARDYHLAAEGRMRVDYNIHAEYTSGPNVCRQVAERAKEAGLGIHVHISETKSEHEECKQRHGGLTPVQYFESLGVFDVPVTAAHCVWVEPDDLRILHEHGATVACNVSSNMKLGSGFAPIPAMLQEGVQVALGTDGPASNNNHDMYQDLYLLSLVYKGFALDPCAVTPAQALYAATRAGALAQGRSDCGSIEVGMRADLAVLDTSGPHWHPMTDALNNLVYAGHGTDVVLTMVDGQVLYRDGQWPTIDVERAKFEVGERSQRIMGELA